MNIGSATPTYLVLGSTFQLTSVFTEGIWVANESTVHRLKPSYGGYRHEPFIDKWFGPDGSQRLRLDAFQQFIIQLHGVFDELEFAMLDVDRLGYITGTDLARSLVAPAPVAMIDRLLNRVCSSAFRTS
jgi:hypothetical protein